MVKIGRCPTCHAHISLEQIAQDESASQLIKLFAQMNGELSRPLVAYLSLFRPEKRDLSNERALRLCVEVCELTTDHAMLAVALSKTVDILRNKSAGPLKNHNYLFRVLTGISKPPGQSVIVSGQVEQKTGYAAGKTEQAFMDLEAMKHAR
jgi:hypothetical protein